MDEIKKKILLVEDEADMLRALKIRLEANNFEVITAHDGLEGLNLARKEQPDLIILDVMLPKMDGFTICRMLKFDERHKHIPVVFLTAKVQSADKQRGKQVCADAYMTKPFKSDELVEKIEEIIKAQ